MIRRVEVSEAGGDPYVVELDPSEPPAAPAGGPDAAAASEPSAAGEHRVAPLLVPLPGTGRGSARVEVVVDGWRFELACEDAARADLRRRATRHADVDQASGPTEIRAIIPGRVAEVRVAPGDAVETGDTLLVVEAMKMQNELRAPRGGTINRVAAGEGETIETGDLLVVIE